MSSTGSNEDLFKKEISKYDEICEEIAQNIDAQEQILFLIHVIVSLIYFSFAFQKKLTDFVFPPRPKMTSSPLSSILRITDVRITLISNEQTFLLKILCRSCPGKSLPTDRLCSGKIQGDQGQHKRGAQVLCHPSRCNNERETTSQRLCYDQITPVLRDGGNHAKEDG